MTQLRIFAPGQEIYVGEKRLARIIAVSIGINYTIEYNIVFWEDTTRIDEWVTAAELPPQIHDNDTPIRPGLLIKDSTT